MHKVVCHLYTATPSCSADTVQVVQDTRLNCSACSTYAVVLLVLVLMSFCVAVLRMLHGEQRYTTLHCTGAR
jgi:hypothetical protein